MRQGWRMEALFSDNNVLTVTSGRERIDVKADRQDDHAWIE